MVGFDLDGTLFDHEAAARAAVLEYLTQRGWPHPENVQTNWLNLEATHFRQHAAGLIGFQEQRRRRMAGLLEMVGADAADLDVDLLFEEYLVHYQAWWMPYADVVPALDGLQRMGLRLAVLTNGQHALQVAKLEQMGILDRFDLVLAASELPAFKPSALAFGAFCDSLGAAPDSVVYVGDDLEADVFGSSASGLTPVWLDRMAAGGAPATVTVIETLADLPSTLE